MAVANYNDTHEHYPPAYLTDGTERPAHSWRFMVLPYIEQQAIHKQYDLHEPWDGPSNGQLLGRMPKSYKFHNRDDPGQTTTNYLAVVGESTMWPGAEPRYQFGIKDGSSSTILIVENRGLSVPWLAPRDLELDSMPFEFNHPHGVSSWYKMPAVVMGDYSVQRLNAGIRPEVLRAMLTVNGGESFADVEGQWQLLPDGRQREDAPPGR